MRIFIIDFVVAWDTGLEEARDIKLAIYEPLAAIIYEHMFLKYGFKPEVEVIPIVVGARGMIPWFWNDMFQKMNVGVNGATQLANKLSAIAIEGSQVVFKIWRDHWKKMEACSGTG